MNSPLVIETFTTETFYEQLSGTNTWTENIYIDHHVDEIILKNISVYDADTTTTDANKTKLFILKSNLVSDRAGIIATFPLASAYHENYHIPFKNNRPIGGTYEFRVTAIDGSTPVGGVNFDMYVGITLQFIKYKKSTKDEVFLER
eukprot:Lithocolla_globosa_v1_NODE_9316_length_720_cov_32.314286.p1 type:complete len:146 gc:universal NODE_9316_length_720_cov_32.314286:593-156(-)